MRASSRNIHCKFAHRQAYLSHATIRVNNERRVSPCPNLLLALYTFLSRILSTVRTSERRFFNFTKTGTLAVRAHTAIPAVCRHCDRPLSHTLSASGISAPHCPSGIKASPRTGGEIRDIGARRATARCNAQCKYEPLTYALTQVRRDVASARFTGTQPDRDIASVPHRESRDSPRRRDGTGGDGKAEEK